MKRRKLANANLTYDRCESRQLLASISNGQEIESSFSAGGSQTFEYEATSLTPILISVGSTEGSIHRPQIEVRDDNGFHANFDPGRSRANAAFVYTPDTLGTQEFVITEESDFRSLEFRIRVLSFGEDAPTLIAGRDQTISDGFELTTALPLESASVFSLSELAQGEVLLSAGTTISTDDGITPEQLITPGVDWLVFDGQGLEVSAVAVSGIQGAEKSVVQFRADGESDYYAVALSHTAAEYDVRAVALGGDLDLIPGRDAPLPNGTEITTELEPSGLGVFPFQVSEAGQTLFDLRHLSNADIPNRSVPRVRVFTTAGDQIEETELELLNRQDAFGVSAFDLPDAGSYVAVLISRISVLAPPTLPFFPAFDTSPPTLLRRLTLNENPALTDGRDVVLQNGAIEVVSPEIGQLSLLPFDILADTEVRIAFTQLLPAGTPTADLGYLVLRPDGSVEPLDTSSRQPIVQFRSTQEGRYHLLITRDFSGIFGTSLPDLRISVQGFFFSGETFATNEFDRTLENGVEVTSAIPRGEITRLTIPVTAAGTTILPIGFAPGERFGPDVEVFDSSGNVVVFEEERSNFGTEITLTSSGPEIYTVLVVSRVFREEFPFTARAITLPGTPSLIGPTESTLENGQVVNTQLITGRSALFPFSVEESGPTIIGVNDSGFRIRIFDQSGQLVAEKETGFQVSFDSQAGETYYAVVGKYVQRQIDPALVTLILRRISLPGVPQLVSGVESQLDAGDSIEFPESTDGFRLVPIEVDASSLVAVSIAIDDESSFGAFDYEIYNPDGVLVRSGDGRNSLIEVFEATEAGVYSLIVGRTSDPLRIATNAINQLPIVGNGQELVSAVEAAEFQVIPVNVVAGDNVFVSVNKLTSDNQRAEILLYSPSGQLLDTETLISASRLDFLAEETGRYTVVVTGGSNTDPAALDFRFRAVNVGQPIDLVDGLDVTFGDDGEVTLPTPAFSGSLRVIRLNVAAPSAVYFSSSGSSFAVFDPAGNRLDSETGLSATQPFPGVLFDAATAGEYTLVLNNGVSSSESLQTFEFASFGDGVSNLSGLVGTLLPGEEATGSIPRGDQVIFSIDVAQAGRVRVDVGDSGGEGWDPRLQAYASDGTFITQNARSSFGRKSGNESISFNASEPGQYLVFVSDFSTTNVAELANFSVRALVSPGELALIDGRDGELSDSDRVTSSIPSNAVAYFPIDVSASGDFRLSVANNLSLQLLDPAGQSVSLDNVPGGVQFSAQSQGQYILVAINTSGILQELVEFQLLPNSLAHDLALVGDSDQPIYNGQEITGTIQPGGQVVIPLDFDVQGFGQLNVSGTNINGRSIPLVEIFDADGNFLARNDRFDFFGATSITLDGFLFGDQLRQGLVAIVSDPNANVPTDFTLRAASFGSAVATISGRDQPLTSGVPFTSNLPAGTFAQFPIEVQGPGNLDIAIDAANLEGQFPRVTFRIVGPDGEVLLTRSGTNEATGSAEVTTPGTYHVLVDLDRSDAQTNDFTITATGIAQASPSIVAFTRDGRRFDAPEVLSRPNEASLLALTFDRDVDVSADNLTLRNDSTGNTIDISAATFTYDSVNSTATWDLGTLAESLPPGFYSVSIAAESIDSGQLLNTDFSGRFLIALTGDANLDGKVDVLNDAFALIASLGRQGSATWTNGDFNSDRQVNVLGDAFGLVGNLGQSVVPAEIVSLTRDGEPATDLVALDRPDLVNRIDVAFSVDVDVELQDLTLTNATTQTDIPIPLSAFSYNSATMTATWDLSLLDSALLPGNYELLIDANDVRERDTDRSLLNDYEGRFYVVLPGDLNYDGRVDVLSDAAILVSNLGREGDARWSDGDLNGDGNVDVLGDAAVLVSRLGQSIERDAAFAEFSG